MNDVFRFLALAVAIGLAAGMLLGGIALLLAAPAYADGEQRCDGGRFSPRYPMVVEPPRTPARPLMVMAARSQ